MDFASQTEVTKTVIEKVKEARLAIDKNFRDVASLRKIENEGKAAREFSLVITKLEEAKMWLGKALGELGQQLPKEFRDESV
jgi:hypothetical protein